MRERERERERERQIDRETERYLWSSMNRHKETPPSPTELWIQTSLWPNWQLISVGWCHLSNCITHTSPNSLFSFSQSDLWQDINLFCLHLGFPWFVVGVLAKIFQFDLYLCSKISVKLTANRKTRVVTKPYNKIINHLGNCVIKKLFDILPPHPVDIRQGWTKLFIHNNTLIFIVLDIWNYYNMFECFPVLSLDIEEMFLCASITKNSFPVHRGKFIFGKFVIIHLYCGISSLVTSLLVN